MISASVLAVFYILFCFSLFVKDDGLFAAMVIGGGGFCLIHFLYFTFGISFLKTAGVFPFVPGVDDIGEKTMRRIIAGYKRIGFEDGLGNDLHDAVFYFYSTVMLFLILPVLRDLNSSSMVSSLCFLIYVLISLPSVASYLLRYLKERVEIINLHKHKRQSWRLAALNWKPESDLEKRIEKNLYHLGGMLFEADLFKADEFPDDVVDSTGEPLLSWRVQYAFERKNGYDYFSFGTTEKPLNFSQKWDAPENLTAAIPKPSVYFNLVETESCDALQTCVVRIKEVHNWVKTRRPTKYDKALKVYFVVVSTEDAVTWTCPKDVSWTDLANGAVKLYGSGEKSIAFVSADGSVWITDTLPDSVEDWKAFLGIDREFETIDA